MPREQLHGCERLDGLAESHLIGDETAPRASGEQGTLGLVRIQRRLQQPLQSGTLRTLRVRRLERAAAMRRVAGLGDEIQHIVIAPDLVAALAGVLEEFIELQVLAARKHITGSRAEEQPGPSCQGLRARGAGAEADLPLAAVAQIDLAVAGPRASAQRPHSSRTTLESRQNEFDVLAGTEIIGGEVRAAAEVVAGLPTANGDAIPATALGVGDAVFREHRLLAEILDLELLLAAELPAQLPLPGIRREIGGPAQMRELRLCIHQCLTRSAARVSKIASSCTARRSSAMAVSSAGDHGVGPGRPVNGMPFGADR